MLLFLLFYLSPPVSLSRNGRLQRENGELKGHLKSLKKRLKEVDRLETSVLSLRQEMEQNQTMYQGEIGVLQKQVRMN